MVRVELNDRVLPNQGSDIKDREAIGEDAAKYDKPEGTEDLSLESGEAETPATKLKLPQVPAVESTINTPSSPKLQLATEVEGGREDTGVGSMLDSKKVGDVSSEARGPMDRTAEKDVAPESRSSEPVLTQAATVEQTFNVASKPETQIATEVVGGQGNAGGASASTAKTVVEVVGEVKKTSGSLSGAKTYLPVTQGYPPQEGEIVARNATKIPEDTKQESVLSGEEGDNDAEHTGTARQPDKTNLGTNSWDTSPQLNTPNTPLGKRQSKKQTPDTLGSPRRSDRLSGDKLTGSATKATASLKKTRPRRSGSSAETTPKTPGTTSTHHPSPQPPGTISPFRRSARKKGLTPESLMRKRNLESDQEDDDSSSGSSGLHIPAKSVPKVARKLKLGLGSTPVKKTSNTKKKRPKPKKKQKEKSTGSAKAGAPLFDQTQRKSDNYFDQVKQH